MKSMFQLIALALLSTVMFSSIASAQTMDHPVTHHHSHHHTHHHKHHHVTHQ